MKSSMKSGWLAVRTKKREIDAWIKSADEDEAVCMKYLYAYMHPCDIVSYDVEVIASYVKATLDMYANVPYAKKVPAELVLYIMYYACVSITRILIRAVSGFTDSLLIV